MEDEEPLRLFIIQTPKSVPRHWSRKLEEIHTRFPWLRNKLLLDFDCMFRVSQRDDPDIALLVGAGLRGG
ncbi:Protein of unknown function [Pyronema omphalodes CBS 100304]|uniref:Uncharacterized protein n=1 Tax=Pyronema omphalodes (strain CBS 100304) TaxID=1076935 RepID=U4LKF7_PYROM|nr:Protein of unknown function [Pyronema omphalodes CBS 100304]